jgi:hypothetical protein
MDNVGMNLLSGQHRDWDVLHHCVVREPCPLRIKGRIIKGKRELADIMWLKS